MKGVAFVIVTLALLLLLPACVRQGGEVDNRLVVKAPERARVSETVLIRVTDEKGNPVEGADFYHGYVGGRAVSSKKGEITTFFPRPLTYEYIVSKEGFTEATGTIEIVPGVVEFAAFGGVHIGPPPLPTQPPQINNFRSGMPVQFRLRNIGSSDITLPNTAPWRIETLDGRTAFTPVAATMLVRLAPGEAKEWQWQQEDDDGKQVSTGNYIVVLNCSEGEYRCLVNIIPQGVQ